MSKLKAQAAGSPPAAPSSDPLGMIPPTDGQGQDQEGGAQPADADQPTPAAESAWPIEVVFRNHGDVPFVEPASGLLLAPGETRHKVLADEAHAVDVVSAVRSMATAAGLGDRVAIEGLPEGFEA